MAEITPFRGILYNTEKIKNISDVVTPPYDVISDKERDAFYQRHPNSVVRLDKGKPEATDTAEDNPHTRAASYFTNWLKEGVLIEDADPALFLTAVKFEVEGKPVTRFGLIARVRLEPFDKGIVLPHETTFSKVKTERLELIKTCRKRRIPVVTLASTESKRRQAESLGADHALNTHGAPSEFRTTVLRALSKPEIE